VHADGIPGAEYGMILAKLGLLHLSDDRFHVYFSRQTRSGGAGTQRTIDNSTEVAPICLLEIT
jgi:hypothetical protein